MSTESNVMPDSSVRSPGIAAAVIPWSRQLYWSVRRELWESRTIYVAPVAVAAMFLFGFLISIIRLLIQRHAAPWLDPMQQRELFRKPYELAEDLIMGAAVIVGVFYSIDALYSERRDRSILFWKSLPISDLITVLSKASIPIVMLPLLTFAITVVTQWMMLVISSAALLGSGQSVWTLWLRLSVFQMWPMLLFHFLCIHGLWQAPIFGWLLFVSAWARRAPILWATLPPLAIGFAERAAFNTTHFGALIGSRFTGGAEGEAIMKDGRAMSTLTLAPVHFFINPGLWIGLAITAAFLASAIRLRRNRGPI